MRSKLAPILSILFIALSAQLCAEDRWSVPDLLPADTLGVITLRDVPTVSGKIKETALWKILTHPDVERVFSKPLAQARGGIFAGEVMLQAKTADLVSFLSQGEISFAVLGVARQPNGMPLADVLLSIQLRDKADAFVEEFNKRLDQLKAATNGKLESTVTKLGNATITQLSFPDFPSKINCALCDGTFLICLGEGRVEKLIAMREKMKGGIKPDAAPPEILAQLPTYQAAMTKAGSEADLVAFINVEAITQNTIINDPNRPMNATEKFNLDASGAREIRAVSYSIAIKGAGVRENIFVDVPAAKRKGVLGLLDGETADLKAFGAAPKNSILAWTFKVNPEQILEKLLVLRELEDPNARENAAQALFAIGQQLNLDPKKDILGALSGQGVLSVSIPAKNPKIPLAFPQPVLALQIKDKDALKKTTAALAGAAQDRMEFKEVTDGDATITVARDRDQKQGFCYTVVGDDLLLSIYPLALREEIHRRAAAKGARLDEDPDYVAARAKMTGNPQSLLYVDTAALAVAAYDVLIPIAQMAGQARAPELDLTALPTADLLTQNLGGSLVDLQFLPDGVLIESYSPGGLATTVLPIAAASGFYFARQAQPGVAMAEARQAQLAVEAQPDGNPIRRMAAARAAARAKGDPKQIQALEKLSRDLKAYAQEHEGNFPQTLDEMKPKYLQDLGKDIEQIVYRGKQAADNFVVAHSSEKLPGNITILLQSGAITSITRDLLGKVLQMGFTDANAPVKPPKAGPDF